MCELVSYLITHTSIISYYLLTYIYYLILPTNLKVKMSTISYIEQQQKIKEKKKTKDISNKYI